MASGLLPEGVDDPYLILEVSRSSSAKEIRKAYRRKARDIHPDKNPDDPNAEVNFHKLQAAFEFLEDVKKRLQYNEILQRDDERRERFEKQTTEKRRFAEKLEKREQQPSTAPVSEQQLRKDTLRRAREENEEWLSKKNAERQQKASTASHVRNDGSSSQSSSGFVEVLWNPETSMSPVGVTKASLNFHFSAFGIPTIHTFDTENGKAIIELPSRESAIESALQFMQNRSKYPFKAVKFLKRQPNISPTITPNKPESPPTQPPIQHNLADLELDVLSRLRQAVSHFCCLLFFSVFFVFQRPVH